MRCTIAVLIPCYNEEVAVATVVKDFQAALPEATVFVFDNNSTDNTAAAARAAGAEVFEERRQGKGFVVRRMFTDIDADVYVLVDGDATYDAPSARRMVNKLLHDRLDMVVGDRVDQDVAAYRAGHRAGNWLLTSSVATMFGPTFQRHAVGLSRVLAPLRQILSDAVRRFRDRDRAGHPCARTRIAGRRNRHAVLRTARRARPPSSRPGATASAFCGPSCKLYRSERPLTFFGALGAVLAVTSIGLAVPVVITFLETHTVPRLPTAVLSMGLMLMAFLSFSVGLVLDTVTRGRREMKLLAYLRCARRAKNGAAHDPEKWARFRKDHAPIEES